MSDTPPDNVARALRFVRTVEAGADGPTLEALLHPDVQQIELPNRLFPDGARRDRAALLASAVRGRQVLRSQRYEVRGAVGDGERVALEIAWTGVLAVALGARAPGDELRAHLAMFLEFSEGRIIAIRNYDCYEAT